MHEHLFIFRKPVEGEDLSKIRYSTWKGVKIAQAGEEEADWKGLLDWENMKKQKKHKFVIE